MFYIRSTAIALAVAATVGLVSASSHAEPVSVAVSFADLDLTTLAGERTLRKRVSGAIKTTCGRDVSADVMMEMVRRACIRNASQTAETHVAAVLAQTHRVAYAEVRVPATAY